MSFRISIPNYSLMSSYSLVQDLNRDELKNLHYHVQHQDYFGTLATVLQLWNEGILSHQDSRAMVQTLDELEHLQNNYRIMRK